MSTPTLAYARESFAREKHPDNDEIIELRRQGFDRLIAEIRAEAWRDGSVTGWISYNQGVTEVEKKNPYRDEYGRIIVDTGSATD